MAIAPFAAAMHDSWARVTYAAPDPATHYGLSLDDLLLRLRRLGPVHGSSYAAGLLDLLDRDPGLRRQLAAADLAMLAAWRARSGGREGRRDDVGYSASDVAPFAAAMQESWATNYAAGGSSSFNEADHPRAPGGTEAGGEFVSTMDASYKNATASAEKPTDKPAADKPAAFIAGIKKRADDAPKDYDYTDLESEFEEIVSKLSKDELIKVAAGMGIKATSGPKGGPKVIEAIRRKVFELKRAREDIAYSESAAQPAVSYAAEMHESWAATANYSPADDQPTAVKEITISDASPADSPSIPGDIRAALTAIVREALADLGDARHPPAPPVVNVYATITPTLAPAPPRGAMHTELIYDGNDKIIGKIERPIGDDEAAD